MTTWSTYFERPCVRLTGIIYEPGDYRYVGALTRLTILYTFFTVNVYLREISLQYLILYKILQNILERKLSIKKRLDIRASFHQRNHFFLSFISK